MKRLRDYRTKRPEPAATSEPFGGEAPVGDGEGTLSGAFVVHLHDATRRHYDVRLEVAGVLTSFAVPRGPSLDPSQKHLAVNTEDHPIEYLDFEDVIPAGQYGGGPMIAWDLGRVAYLEGPAEEELASGKLHVELRGFKLHGRFAFVKLAKSEKGNEWLLFKKDDAFASKERDVIAELPRSVLSGLTVEELARAEAIAKERVTVAFSRGAARLGDAEWSDLCEAGARRVMTTRDGTPAGNGDGWVFDPELDGVRVLALRDGDRVALYAIEESESGSGSGSGSFDLGSFYPDVVRALRALPHGRVALDGEIVAFDAGGRPSAALLASRVADVAKGDTHRATTTTPVVLVAKDLLCVDDADARGLPLEARRELLATVLPGIGFLRASPPLEGPLPQVLASCAALGVRAVVAKEKGAPYASCAEGANRAKSAAWLRVPSGATLPPRVAIDHRAPEIAASLRKVTVTNRAKVFWPDEAYTKGDLCDYYASIAGTMLPYLRDRPVILVRYPDGIAGKSFFQWNVPPGMPSWVKTLVVPGEDDDKKRGFLVDDAATLLYIANLGCIPIHILACHLPHLDHADFFTIDFDVKQSELRHAVTLARTLKEILDALGLPSFPKTSGQSGLHVLVPLGPAASFDTARGLADLLGTLLVQRHQDIATMERVVAKRGARVYVDTGQTGPSRAIVAPWSVRAVTGAPVSTPLAWDEVAPSLHPRAFTMKTVVARVAERGDPMAPLLTTSPDVAGAVGKLADLVARGSRAD